MLIPVPFMWKIQHQQKPVWSDDSEFSSSKTRRRFNLLQEINCPIQGGLSEKYQGAELWAMIQN